MGIEPIGFAKAHQADLWAAHIDYANNRTEEVETLAEAGIPVSLYNLPLCALDRSLWPYAVQSISPWKNDYLPACDACAPGDLPCTGNLIMSNALMIVSAATLGALGTEPPKGQSDLSRLSEMDGKYATVLSTSLNAGRHNLYAGHRSHSSHRSQSSHRAHSSGAGSSYRSYSPPPATYTPPPSTYTAPASSTSSG
ncbi:hypothetical protein G6F22_016526 [Rhizopus arrhizus]|nr:hypothetical protein G6F22_016526 [Rhizopus arrhizus]